MRGRASILAKGVTGAAVSEDRRGGDVVWEEAGCGGFVQEVVRPVSVLRLLEEGATADGEESGCAGAGGMEKGGLLAALQAKGLRRGEEGVFADEMRLGLLRQEKQVEGKRGEKQRRRIELRYVWMYLVLGVDPMRGRLW
jgi:hypothetical protein